MLKYEKKWHFDEHYRKLQSLKIEQRISTLLLGCTGYIILYLFSKYVLSFIPDIQPWGNYKVLFAFYSIEFSKYDCGYFTFGLFANLYGSMRLARLTTQIHSIKDEDNHAPTKLLTRGYYAKVRHPMYGTFIILYSCFLLSLRSFWGIIFVLVVVAFQYFNATHEENKELIPLFGEEYENYSKGVRFMLLTKWEIIILLVSIFLSVIGLII